MEPAPGDRTMPAAALTSGACDRLRSDFQNFAKTVGERLELGHVGWQRHVDHAAARVELAASHHVQVNKLVQP